MRLLNDIIECTCIFHFLKFQFDRTVIDEFGRFFHLVPSEDVGSEKETGHFSPSVHQDSSHRTIQKFRVLGSFSN